MAYTEIDDPSAYFQCMLYTGTRANLNVTFDGNSDMSPNLVWVKDRTNTNNQIMFDSVRGINKAILPNAANAETTYTDSVTAFNSDGFTLGDDDEGQCNVDGNACASWNWKANGAGSANTDGSISSTVSANTTSGFSIVKWSGTAGNATVGHGLGAVPKMIIIKNLSDAYYWVVYHQATGNTAYTRLNTEDASSSSLNMFQNTTPTSSVFSLTSQGYVNGGGGNQMIAYCFAEKQGYSKFSSYKGNGNADGTFVYTGMRPAFVMIKRSDVADSWCVFDNKRLGYNVNNNTLFANQTATENTEASIDFLSNGFKIRGTQTRLNTSGGTYIFMVFAEESFVSSSGVPATAR